MIDKIICYFKGHLLLPHYPLDHMKYRFLTNAGWVILENGKYIHPTRTFYETSEQIAIYLEVNTCLRCKRYISK